MELRNADGSLVLESDETFTRVVHTAPVLGDFSGVISVPAFDDTKGLFYVSYRLMKFNVDGGVRLADSADWSTTSGSRTRSAVHPAAMPTLAWANGPKEMTITPSALPGAWPRYGSGDRPDYTIIFLHYR